MRNFKRVILGLMLKDRSNRMDSRPTKKLLELESVTKKLQIEG